MTQPDALSMSRNIALYPWFKFAQNLLFWQSVWFLFLQDQLSGQEAIVLYALREVSTTVLEVPTGVVSDRLGRRRTLILSVVMVLLGGLLLATGAGFAMFAVALILMGAGEALASGTDSAFQYQSLSAVGRADDIEAEQLRAWRFTFAGLALSAVAGGAMALLDLRLVFWATALVAAGMLPLCLMLREPPHADGPDGVGQVTAQSQMASLMRAMQHKMLRWLFALSVLMYGYGHLPFVFGQPFILESLTAIGLGSDAPLVSGIVSAAMMVVSLGASMLVPWAKARLGVVRLLLAAFALQIGLALALALSNAAGVIALLLLRMVPSSVSGPVIVAQVQPLLSDDTRATYLSIQSLFGRLVFSAALFLASRGTSDAADLAYADIRSILLGFVAVGLLGLVGLAITARHSRGD